MTAARASGGVEAVIFDWGGTLTPWRTVDFRAEARALARAVAGAAEEDHPIHAARLHEAGRTVWAWSRDEQRSATIADLFRVAGLEHDPERLGDYYDFWLPHTHTDPEAVPLLDRLRRGGVRVGVLSNTIWPREWHAGFFERDGLAGLIDADVYTSEIPWTKPSPHAFRAAMDALGVADPARCVYVGDRLYDDVWGARSAGMRAVHIPHSVIPEDQRGHTEGAPDGVASTLADVAQLVEGWA
jgi:putative hydrolase of the HAD superfamily